MNKVYTPKQRELLALWQCGKLKRMNILEGSVRSGKTWISLVLWAFWVASMPEDGNYLMVAKTLTSLRRNCLDLLETLVGAKNFSYSLSKKEGALFGRRIYLEGVNDARAESKIRGMTLSGAYCDELTLFSEDFFSMLLSRLSMTGAKLIGTTNPDSPYHWLKEKYIDRIDDLNLYAMKFLIEDNTFLDSEYVENLKREYTGVFYERFILGAWVIASGLVYPNFDEKKHVMKCGDMDGLYYISIDYGTLNPCSMGLWCIADGKAHRIREYYYDGRKTRRQMTDEEYARALEGLAGGRRISAVIVDPSAASFIEVLRRKGWRVRKAENDVLSGIRLTSDLLKAGKIVICEGCADCLREMDEYVWDLSGGGKDKVRKEHDHAMDDMRYFAATVLGERQEGVSAWAVERRR